MATDWSNFAPVDTAPAESSVKWDNFEPANAEEKARLGEEMKSLRRDRKFGNAEEAAIKGAEYFTQGVSKMFPTSAIGGVMDALGVQPPIPAEHVKQAREFLSGLPARTEIPADVPTVGPAFDPGIEKGVNQFVDEMVSGLTRPDQVALLAAGGKFPTEVARTFQLAPVVEAPQQIQQIQQASEAGDVPGTVKGIAGLTAGALLPSVIEAGINKPTAITKGKPNARPISEPATLYGDVQPLAQPAEVLPAAENLGRIQPETSGGIPATPEPAQPARPREENQVPLNRDPNDPAWRAKVDAERSKIVSRAKELSNRSGNEFDANDPVYDELAQAIAAGHADEFIERQSFGHLDLSGNIGDEQSVAGPAGPGHEALAAARETANDLRKLAGLKPIPPLTSETFGPKTGEAKAPVTNSLKVGEAPTPADIHAATHEEFMAYHDAMKAPGEQRAAVNEFAKSLDENGIKEAERLAQVSRDKAKEIINGDGPLETRFKQSMEENQRTQFLAEGARTAKAMKAVEEGSTPAEAAKKLGVPVSALEAPKSPVAEVKAPEPVKPVEAAKRLAVISTSHRATQRLKNSVEGEIKGGYALNLGSKNYLYDVLDTPKNREAVEKSGAKIHKKETETLNARYAESAPAPEPVKTNGKKAPASKQAELTFEEQKAEQAELNKAHDEPRSYTSATEDESGRLYLNPIGPLIRMTVRDIRDFSDSVKKSAEWIIEKGREAAGHGKGSLKENFSAAGKANDFNKGVLNWSMKEQKSFGDAARLQRDIFGRVPDSIREEAVVNWIQAGGDDAVLAHRAATTTNNRLKKGYELARQLTPEELQFARDTKAIYDILGQRAQAYGVLNTFRDNYVTQAWKIKNIVGGAARTLKDRFKYAKARTFDSFYDGEQAGFIPKTKQLSKLLPAYLHEMNSVIAAKQLVKELQSGVAPDGREILVPKGEGTPVSGPTGDATLITPKSVKGDTSDYKVIPNQPALSDWTWAAKDTAGNNIFLKADLAVHPKYYHHLKNILSQSAIREWYKSDTGASAMIPKMVAQTIDQIGIQTKRTMFGLLAPFHQVQEGFHGLLGHRVNAFSVPEIDLSRFPEQADAAKHGLMLLPDRASESQFMDGFRASGVISHVPLIGTLSDAYSRYLFHDYIPGIKFDTYKHALARNLEVFAKDIASGKVSVPDVKITTAQQVNAAYGHLNYALIGRNPTIAHILRAGLVAPDFFEARIRFTGQAAKGALGFKIGREGILALGLLALSQATMAYTASKMFGGQWDYKHPFEMTKNGKRYTMRSIPEDIASFIKDPRRFLNSRMSPGVSTIDQVHSGLDYKHERISTADTLKEAALKPLPLTARAALHMGPKSLSAWEQLAGSFGLKISAADPKVDKAIELKDRTALLSNKLRKLNRIERYKTAKDELKDLPPKDRNTVIDKLRRQGVFTYQ